MVVVSIIGILSNIARPTFKRYQARAKLAEAMSLTAELKPRIIDFFRDKGRFPKNNFEAGLPMPEYLIGNYVQKIEVENGAFHIHLGQAISLGLQGKIISLRPLVVKGSPASPISWGCGFAKPPKGMKAMGEDKTNIPRDQILINCL